MQSPWAPFSDECMRTPAHQWNAKDIDDKEQALTLTNDVVVDTVHDPVEATESFDHVALDKFTFGVE